MLIHPSRAVDQQCASSCVVWIVVAVHSEVVIFKHDCSDDGVRAKSSKISVMFCHKCKLLAFAGFVVVVEWLIIFKKYNYC